MEFDWWGGEEDLRRVGRVIYYMKNIFNNFSKYRADNSTNESYSEILHSI